MSSVQVLDLQEIINRARVLALKRTVVSDPNVSIDDAFDYISENYYPTYLTDDDTDNETEKTLNIRIEASESALNELFRCYAAGTDPEASETLEGEQNSNSSGDTEDPVTPEHCCHCHSDEIAKDSTEDADTESDTNTDDTNTDDTDTEDSANEDTVEATILDTTQPWVNWSYFIFICALLFFFLYGSVLRCEPVYMTPITGQHYHIPIQKICRY